MSSIGKNIGKVKGQFKETFKITTTRPVAILMIVIGIFVFGWQSYEKLPLNLMPEISYPSLTVRTEYPGAAPEEVENNISKRVESALAVVDSLENISSISKPGLSDVILEFKWNTDMNLATSDVRERLDQISGSIPEDAEKPLILRYDPSLDPIVRIALFAEENEEGISDEGMATRIRDYAENEIREKLESVEGVAAVRIRGGLERELLIELDKDALVRTNIDPTTVINRVRAENINVPGGNLREGETEYQVRVLNEYRDLETIRNLIIDRRGGIETRLGELANVRWFHKEREIFTRVDGRPSVEIDIFKEADANIVAVAQRVRDRIFGTPQEQAIAQRIREMRERRESGEAEEEARPQQNRRGGNGRGGFQQQQEPTFLAWEVEDRNWKYNLLTDQSIFIRNSIDEVRNNAFIGGILAVIVLFLFLRSVKSTVLIGLTIPISVVATFAPMMLFGVSLNIMSLGGLALGIGMLVDNSIVVLESIFRCREEGDSLIEAVIRGTGEVGGAVFASTMTTIAVFFPIVFVEGVAGQVFGDMSLTVVFSLLASLLCALFFIPMLASRQIPVDTVQRSLPIGKWSFPSARNVLDKIKAKYESGRGFLGKAGAVLLLIPLSIFWSVIAVPGILYDLLFRRGESLNLAKRRISGFWQKREGLTASPVVKIVLFIPHHLFFGIVFIVDVLLDTLGRPFNSARLSGERFRGYWQKQRGRFGKLLMIVTAIPFHLYIGLVFIVHFLFEVFGRLLGIAGLLVFRAIRLFIVIVGGAAGLIIYPILWGFGKVLDGINRVYPVFVRWALANKLAVIAIALLITIHAGTLVLGLRAELIPETHQGEFNVRIKAPVGTDIEKTNELTQTVENAIINVLSDGTGEHNPREFETMATVVGAETSSNTRSDEGENTSVITVLLKESQNIKEAEESAIGKIRRGLMNIPGITAVTFDRPVLFSFKTPIEVEIKGQDRELLKRYSADAVKAIEEIEGIIDVDNSVQPGSPELLIEFDRDKLNRLGLDARAMADKVSDLVQGNIPTEYRREDRQYDVRVRLQRADIRNKADLENLQISQSGSKIIRLSEVAFIRTSEGPNEIRRIDQERTALISANVSGIDLRTATDQIRNKLENLRTSWQPDYRYEITGQTEEMEVSSNSLQWALALAVFLVYIVMASQFESLLQPFIIIFTIPLAMIGVIYMLQLTGTPVSIVVFIGAIMLAGIVVNNAIVLVDYINQLRSRGLEKLEAIVEAGKARLRPILMTTLTTVLGLLPLALGLGAGTEIRAPMAWTVIAGLLSSTLLTLILIPTVYAVIDRRKFDTESGPPPDSVAPAESEA